MIVRALRASIVHIVLLLVYVTMNMWPCEPLLMFMTIMIRLNVSELMWPIMNIYAIEREHASAYAYNDCECDCEGVIMMYCECID